MLVIHVKRVLVLPRLHQGIGKSGDGYEIVVYGKELASERTGIGQAAAL